VVIRAATPDGAARIAAAAREPGPTVAGTVVTIRVAEGPAVLPALLRAVPDVAVETAEVRRATLDDVFLALTGRSLRESAAATGTTADTETPGA
jgi:ABC-2 type transport system ATP-binding protein